MKAKKWIIILIIIIVALVIISLIKGGSGAGTMKVSTEKAKIRTIIETVSASGKIQPETVVVISSDVSGEIIEMPIKEGQYVKQGDLLLKIDPDLVESAVNRAEAALNTSKANLLGVKARLVQAESRYSNTKASFERNESLFKEKVISQAEFDQAKSDFEIAKAEVLSSKENVRASEFNVKSADATLSESKANLGRTSIYSPMEGTVIQLNKEKGERVVGTAQMAGTDIVSVADLSVMEVTVEVNENDIVRVNVGDTAEIEVDAYLDEKFKGVVTEIANSANVSGSSAEQVTNFNVKIRILQNSYQELLKEQNKKLSPFRPGMSATVDIQTKTAKNVVSVPIQAVSSRAAVDSSEKSTIDTSKLAITENQECIFIIENNRTKQVNVKTGIQNTSFIEIKEGIKEGEPIIVGPYSAVSKMLKDGDEVEVVDQNKLFIQEKK